ncbi:zinc finger domain-containing protein [Chitinophaga sp. MM2321]|uniref:zinc finger domain-containing protein n=1 Tax=Chitinophaga sp. MM2321 TaxID=3137178 RepID=UPI0032D5AB5A
MSFEEKTSETVSSLKCQNCGSILHYAPGTNSLRCEYCGTVNMIEEEAATTAIHAFGYDDFIAAEQEHRQPTSEAVVVKCTSCGASTTMLPNVTADACPFCASPLVIDHVQTTAILQPHYVLPFVVKDNEAVQYFRKWMEKLWFAPSDMVKKVKDSSSQQLKGIYIPHWSYDTNTHTEYSGQRGEYYYVTETYTQEVNGRTETRTRQVRHTAWHSASGSVENQFRDVLVSASPSLPLKMAQILEPWHLEQLKGYDGRYLSGFRAELYQTNAEQGLVIAKKRMDPVIRGEICSDIGGDEQRIDNYDVDYNDLGLKYLLLPVWISAYRYNGKLYHFVVNACTGEVTGDRPYSWIKIAGLVITIILALIVIYQLFANQ